MPTVVELKAEAKRRGIPRYSTMNKAALEKALGKPTSRKSPAKKSSPRKASRKSPAKKVASAKKCPQGKVRNTVTGHCRNKCTSAQRVDKTTGNCVSKKASSPRRKASSQTPKISKLAMEYNEAIKNDDWRKAEKLRIKIMDRNLKQATHKRHSYKVSNKEDFDKIVNKETPNYNNFIIEFPYDDYDLARYIHKFIEEIPDRESNLGMYQNISISSDNKGTAIYGFFH